MFDATYPKSKKNLNKFLHSVCNTSCELFLLIFILIPTFIFQVLIDT